MDYRNSKECKANEQHEHFHSDYEVCLSDACTQVEVQSVCGILGKFLSCDTAEVVIPASGQEVEFSIKSSAAWEIECPEIWADGSEEPITLEYTKGIGKTTFKISSVENWNYTRVVNIIIKNRHEKLVIPVKQRYYCMGFMTSEGDWWRCTDGLLVTTIPHEDKP